MQEVIGAIAKTRYAEMMADLKAVIRLNSENPPGREEEVAQYVGDRLKALGAKVELGRPATFGACRAGTDMTFLMAVGIPTAIFGPGSIGKAHMVDEYVPVVEMEQAVSVYTQMIWRLLGRASV